MAFSFLATLVGVSICVCFGVYLAVKSRKQVAANSTSVNPAFSTTSFSTPSNEYVTLPSINGHNKNGECLPSIVECAAEVEIITHTP